MIPSEPTSDPQPLSLLKLAAGVVGVGLAVWGGAAAAESLNREPFRGAMLGFAAVSAIAAIGRPRIVLSVMHRMLHIWHPLRVIEEPAAAQIVYAVLAAVAAGFALFAK